MAAYIVSLKPSTVEKIMQRTAIPHQICTRRIVMASGKNHARTLAASAAREMKPFDNPDYWFNENLSDCQNISSVIESGVICEQW